MMSISEKRYSKIYDKYKKRFQAMSDEELLNLKQKSRNTPGWVSTRGAYELALHFELVKRRLQV